MLVVVVVVMEDGQLANYNIRDVRYLLIYTQLLSTRGCTLPSRRSAGSLKLICGTICYGVRLSRTERKGRGERMRGKDEEKG